MREIEARFIRVDPEKLKKKLAELGAKDLGENHLREIIFYDKALRWQESGRIIVRLRRDKKGVMLSYKHAEQDTATGTKEIEFSVDSMEKARLLLEEIGLIAYREQEKYRHSFLLDGVKIEIDRWPEIPPHVEIEGESEEEIRNMAERLGFEWKDAKFGNVGMMIEKEYGIPLRKLRYFTFDNVR